MKKTNIVNTDVANNISIVKFEDSCKNLFSILKKNYKKNLNIYFHQLVVL